jgi:hypothetical protein
VGAYPAVSSSTAQDISGLANRNKLDPFVAPSAATGQYIGGMASLGANNPFTAQTMQRYDDFMGQGAYSGIDAVRGNIAKEVLPQVASMFGQGGFANSTMAQQTASEAMTQALAPFEYDQFNQNMQRQLQGLQLAPTIGGLQYADLQAVGQAGGMRDAINQDRAGTASSNAQMAAQLFGGLGGLGGSQSQTQPGASPLQTVGGLGQLGISGALAYGLLCDRRLKADIEPTGETWRGVDLYTFRYLWDDPDVRRVGPMAQEVPLHARVTLPGGVLAVDMGAL